LKKVAGKSPERDFAMSDGVLQSPRKPEKSARVHLHLHQRLNKIPRKKMLTM
jgi:hypothetical protein